MVEGNLPVVGGNILAAVAHRVEALVQPMAQIQQLAFQTLGQCISCTEYKPKHVIIITANRVIMGLGSSSLKGLL